jgi:hypothetical protein
VQLISDANGLEYVLRCWHQGQSLLYEHPPAPDSANVPAPLKVWETPLTLRGHKNIQQNQTETTIKDVDGSCHMAGRAH